MSAYRRILFAPDSGIEEVEIAEGLPLDVEVLLIRQPFSPILTRINGLSLAMMRLFAVSSMINQHSVLSAVNVG